ncbi:MAG: hypothetical protein OHK0013_04640 [Sandaracinaceae bacterium]
MPTRGGLTPTFVTLALAAFVALATSCPSYDRFRTGPARVFRGTVLGEGESSFIRRGFAAGTTLELLLDPDALERPVAGSITTTAPDGTHLLDDVSLESIAPLAHDLLAEYQFPGAGRLENFLYLARPAAGPLAGREVMVFLSLLDTGEIEVRLVAGVGDESRGDVFGVFRLRGVTP